MTKHSIAFIAAMTATIAATMAGALLFGPLAAQEPDTTAQVAALDFFVGSWSGEESASIGTGQGARTYEIVLQGTYLLGRNRSLFVPQEGLPDGDDHEDWTWFSYDGERGTYVVRQFNSEGYVNRFVMEEGSTVPDRMTFVLEAAENARGGTGRLTYRIIDADTFDESFEFAWPDSDQRFTVSNRWTRVEE